MGRKSIRQEPEFAAWVGLDWAQDEHAVCLQSAGSGRAERRCLEQRPEALHEWAVRLRERFGGRPVAVCLEQSRGALIHALMGYEFLHLYPVNPRSLSSFRQAFRVSGAKDDPNDAGLLLELVRKHRRRLRRWEPADAATRSLQLLTELRRSLVEQRKSRLQQLSSLLRGCFPQALGWAGPLDSPAACALLRRWPTLQRLQKASPQQLRRFDERCKLRPGKRLEERFEEIALARPLTQDEALLTAGSLHVRLLAEQIRSLAAAIGRVQKQIERIFEKHPERGIFSSFPGAGPALAPRLAAAYGTDRSRYGEAEEMQRLSGIAPVTVESGRSRRVRRRYACPKFLLQTFHEFAGCSIPKSPWAKAFYQQQLRCGKDHHAAVRALAFRWMRILFRCWQDRTAYCEARYQQALERRGSPLAQLLA